METISDEDFKKFMEWLPERTKLLYRAGMCSNKVIEEWYQIYKKQTK